MQSIVYSEYYFSRTQKIAFYTSYFFMSIAVSELFYNTPILAIALAPFLKKIRGFLTDFLIEQRKRALLGEFKDLLFMLSTSIGAGRSMKDAIYESIPGIESIYGYRSYLLPEMKSIHRRIEEGNEKDTDVLMDFAIRSGLEDAIDFVNVYSTCRSTGASLIIALNRAAAVIIDKMTIDKEIREMMRRRKREGLLIFAMPVIVIVSFNIFAPDYIEPLYTTFTGRLVMTASIISDIGILEMIKKITDIEL